jgi:hypothetical protein
VAGVGVGEAWDGVAEVAALELRVLVDRAREEALAERAERNEADAELGERGEDLLLGLAPPGEYSLCSAVTGWTA